MVPRIAAWVGVILVIVGTLLVATPARGGIAQSHHDFSSATWTQNQICIPCHTPHDADPNVIAAPLWNHEVSQTTYEVYDSPTLEATVGQPGGASLLCLSCHDGTVAVDSFGGNDGTRIISARGRIGPYLADHHPVSFVYDETLASEDGELHDPSAPSGLGGTIEEDLLRAGRLECVSCHDVHLSRNTQGCSGCHFVHGRIYAQSLSLWKSNDGSGLCLTCHDK